MSLTRREFAAMLVGAAGGSVVPFAFRLRNETGRRTPGPALSLSPEETHFRWLQVSDRVRIAQGSGGNSLLYLGDANALVADSKNFGLGRTLRREAEAYGVRVTQLVNTHHHGDHSGGNDGFSEAVRLAHRNAEPRIVETAAASLEYGEEALSALKSRLAGSRGSDRVTADVEEMTMELAGLAPGDFGPTQTFADQRELSIDGRPAHLHHVSAGHTDGDAFLLLPQENVLHCGDLFFHGRHPYVDITAKATPAGWIRCVDAMLERCDDDTVVVPGHGPLSDRVGLAAQRDYFVRLQTAVQRGLAEGRSREEIQAVEIPELRHLDGGRPYLARNLGIVHDEITA
jgi:cyclase